MEHSLGENMKVDYEKKDVSKSPTVKNVEPEYPSDVLYSKRGVWYAVKNDFDKAKFSTKKEAIEWLKN